MRLIDLDAFEEQNAMRIESQGKEKSYYSIPYLESRAKVEAIPIDWIRKKSDEVIGLPEAPMSIAYVALINQWRKEHAD